MPRPSRPTLVIPAHNEGARLTRLLGELLGGPRPVAAVVLVLDRCTDDSRERVRRAAARVAVDAPARRLSSGGGHRESRPA